MMENTKIENEEHNVLFACPCSGREAYRNGIVHKMRSAFFATHNMHDFDFAHYIYLDENKFPEMLSDFDFAGIYDSDIVVMVRNAKGAKHYPAIRKIARRYKKEILEVDL